MKKIKLLINNIRVEDARRIMETVREIEREDPDRNIFCQIRGLEKTPLEEATLIMKKVFPGRRLAR